MDTGKLGTTPVDLSKLTDTVKNEVAKKTEYNELLKKVNNRKTTDGSGLVKKIDNKNYWSWSWQIYYYLRT